MMHDKGLTKLMEECGELIQVAAKKSNYLETDLHPDEKGSLQKRLAEEAGDVLAAIEFVTEKLRLDREYILLRKIGKIALYERWDEEDG